MTHLNFIINDVIDANSFVTYYTGTSYVNCNTYTSVCKCLESNGLRCKGYTLKNINNVPSNVPCVLVQFAIEPDYTKREYRVMCVYKKYAHRFVENMKKKI